MPDSQDSTGNCTQTTPERTGRTRARALSALHLLLIASVNRDSTVRCKDCVSELFAMLFLVYCVDVLLWVL